MKMELRENAGLRGVVPVSRLFAASVLGLGLSLVQGCFSSGSGADTASGAAGSVETIVPGSGTIDSTSEDYRIGMLKDGAFTQGRVSVGLEELAAGGSAGISVAVVDATGTPVTDPFSVTFNSLCNASGLAEIKSPVSTVSGIASTTYQAKGCSGSDVITARVSIDKDTELSAQGSITVRPAELGAVEFVTAQPTTIALRGMGGAGLTHTAAVRFRVLNTVGGPVENQEVSFSLNTSVGGITLQPDVGRTDSDGYVQTIVNAGDVHTTVRVTAETLTATGAVVKTQSSELVISTGIPDQDSVSLSLSVHNPEAWSYDGEEVDVTVHASDRYNNPVPDGTTVSFYTELGQIQPSCKTANGVCSVKWISSNPRNSGDLAGQVGRSTITAALIGEDSFVDLDGDGLYSASDQLKTDLGEVYQDWVERSMAEIAQPARYDASEPFLDFNKNGQYDADGDGLFTGLGCLSGCSTDGANKNIELKHVSDSEVLVMAESGLSVTHDVPGNSIVLDKGAGNTRQSFSVTVVGASFGQVPPAGTTVSVSSELGKIYGPSSFTMPSSNSRFPLVLSYTLDVSDVTESKTGTVEIKATTPKGVVNFGPSIAVSVIAAP
jgi:hypothetical protein